METRAEAYQRLTRTLDDNAGFRYLTRMKLHERSLHIFWGNFTDLMRTLDFVEDTNNIQAVWTEEKRQDQKFFHREVVRHFHNFLSSAQSLVEHTRIFMKDAHEGQPIYERYELQVENRFANDPSARFIQDLRNYFLHKGVPASKMRLSFNIESRNSPSSAVLLKAQELRKWTRWTKKSREYLDSCNDDFPLRSVVETYQSKILSFYQWFRYELDGWHKEELGAYEALRKEILDFEKANAVK